MKEKPGDIIFLTKRDKKKPFYRWFISNGIAVATKRANQPLNEVKVHAAIIYKADVMMVREMESKSNVSIPFDKYVEMYGDRMEVVSMPRINSKPILTRFNRHCHNDKVKYDYTNTFVWQSIRAIYKVWVGRNTPYRRMCSEDVQRMYNFIKPIFGTPEKTNPNELYFKVK